MTAYNFDRVESDFSNEASLFIPLIPEARGPWVVESTNPTSIATSSLPTSRSKSPPRAAISAGGAQPA